MSIVSIGYNDNITHSINDALRELDIRDIISDKLVAIKPNETYATRNNIDGVTRGDSLQAVIRYIKKYNPKKIVVSGGSGATETEKVFRYTGMMDVAFRFTAYDDWFYIKFRIVSLLYRSIKGIHVYVNDLAECMHSRLL